MALPIDKRTPYPPWNYTYTPREINLQLIQPKVLKQPVEPSYLALNWRDEFAGREDLSRPASRVATFPTLTVELTLHWALWAGLLAIGGSLLGAFYPAIRAARLDPVDSLAYE